MLQNVKLADGGAYMLLHLQANTNSTSPTLLIRRRSEPERTPSMSEKLFAPELFRPHINFPDVPYDHHVRSAAERFPERIAMVYQNMIFNYREVIAMINSIANGLYNLGLRKGDRLCLFVANRPEYTITFIAATSIGVVVSPMNPGYKEREVAYQIENSEAIAILIQSDLVPVLQLALSQKNFSKS